MVNEEILNYLKDGMKRGFSLKVLKDELIKNNFNINEVNDAVNILSKDTPREIPEKTISNNSQSFQPQQSLISQPKSQQGIFKKMGKAIVRPKELFNLTEGEGTWDVLRYWFVLSIIPLIFSLMLAVIISLIFSSSTSTSSSSKMLVGVSLLNLMVIFIGITFALFYIVAPILLFIFTGIFYLILKIFKGQGSFTDTLRVGVYSMTPTSIFVFIPFVQIWSLVLTIIGISITHKISKIQVIFALIIYFVIMGIIFTGLFFLLTFISPTKLGG